MAENVVFVEDMELELFQCLLVPGELVEIVPAHGVKVCLTYFARKHGLVPVEKGEEILELEEVLLLDNLRIDIGRPQRLDLSDKEVPYSLDSLIRSAGCSSQRSGAREFKYLENKLLQQRPYVGQCFALCLLLRVLLVSCSSLIHFR